MNRLHRLKIKIFADGANQAEILDYYQNPLIQGITTNPTLMRKAGVEDYEAFAGEILKVVKDKPVSFEVFSDEFSEMQWQARKMAQWQDNVYVKIPITNTRSKSSLPLIQELAADGIKLNVTAILTDSQVQDLSQYLHPDVPAIVSVFAGRIADTGRDPVPIMKECRQILAHLPKTKLLWASVREVFNIFQAEACGCHIVTVPHDILEKAAEWCGKDLSDLSLETVRTFFEDAQKASFCFKSAGREA